MFKESIKMSWQNIVNNKARSILTVLGVLIGVASVIALVSIVQGVTTNITGQVLDMGANKVSVQINGTPLKQGLTNTDIKEIENIENVSGVSPSLMGKSSIVYNGNVMEDIVVQGKNHIYFSNTDDTIDSGREINVMDVENKTRVCIIGQDIAKEFFGNVSPINQEITIGGITHTVIGTLEKSDEFSAESSEMSVIIPYTTAMSLLSTGYISSLDIYIDDKNMSDTTTAEIKTALLSDFNYNEDGYTIVSVKSTGTIK